MLVLIVLALAAVSLTAQSTINLGPTVTLAIDPPPAPISIISISTWRCGSITTSSSDSRISAMSFVKQPARKPARLACCQITSASGTVLLRIARAAAKTSSVEIRPI